MLLSFFEELCEDGVPSEDYMRFWLQQPAKEVTEGTGGRRKCLSTSCP